MGGLRDLDDRVVPRLAARLRAAVEAGRARRVALRTGLRALSVPAGPGLLQRLDDRFARRGPLALLRDVPQVGLAVVASLLLAGAGVALARGGEQTTERGRTAASASPALGPEVGDQVAAYVEDARERAAELSAEDPDAVHVALVSLTRSQRPEALPSLFEDLDVQRVYLTVPGNASSEVLSADVEDVVGDLRGLYAATAARKAEDREEFVRLSRSIEATTPEQQGFRDFYELSAQLAAREADAYRTGCACAFAVVVQGPAAALAALPALDGVRAVELAPQGVLLEELRVRPLGPEQTTTVEAGAAPRPTRTGG